ncbi:MAG TPA: sigma-54 dependent transcriptional regulator [Candidatus Ozemobacteraceae bacterium]|nr:sigma-54 dependent transcriptional regulator [Candidatus Ozemobacteraceae bacterium]
MKPDNPSIPLLPMQPELLLLRRGSRWVVGRIPSWLAEYLGRTQQAITAGRGDQTDDTDWLEGAFPGVIELAEQVLQTGGSIQDFRARLVDPHEQEHQVLLDAHPETLPNGAEGVAIRFQERPLPASAPAAIDLREASFFGLVGMSQPMQRVFNKIRLYGASDAPVLIVGETGAGKEGIARAVHLSSRRHESPFLTLNCSAITETLFESELFGHEKGSFTSAIRSHKGRFERADRGTLFLDEIGDLPLSSQAKLLRVIEDQTIERVGGEKPLKVDVRLVAATNVQLEEAVAAGRFRADLFYRINALQINVPPLRERPDDLELLIRHFIGMFNEKYGRHVGCLTREAIHLLKQYQWPGNVRELRNLMERLFAETQGEVIGLRSLREWYDERMNAARFARYDSRVTVLPYRNAIPLGTGQSLPAQIPPAGAPVTQPAAVSPENHQFAGNHGNQEWHHRFNQAAPAGNGDAVEVSGVPVHAEPQSRQTGSRIDLDPELIRKAFTDARGNITKAAAILGVHKATLYRHLKTLNMSRTDLEDGPA